MKEYSLKELPYGTDAVYKVLNWIKYKEASKIWKEIVRRYDDWKEHVDKADYWVYESGRLGWKVIDENLSVTDKALYFYETIADNIKEDNWMEFIPLFPDELHEYSEENFKKLIDTLRTISLRKRIDVGHQGVDDESSIMGAISGGYGDTVGF